jgi:hypothetical protein
MKGLLHFARIGDVPSAALIRRPCWRKQRHPTRGVAEAHLRALQRRPDARNPGGLVAYRCRSCDGYHVGHLQPWVQPTTLPTT